MKVALFGLGYWGEKIYSILKKKDIEVLVVEKKHNFEDIKYIDKKEALSDKSINHCFIITPEETHFFLAKECLRSGKNVFVEKPLSLKSEQASELLNLSEKNKCYLAVDQVFLYDSSVIHLEEILPLSRIKEVYSKRWSILKNDKKIHIIQDLMPHDLYIYDYLGVLDCSVLNKNDINKNTKKSLFSKKRATFSFKSADIKFDFDYDWYANQVEREMIFLLDNKEKIVWKKMSGFDEISFYKDNKLEERKVINFIDPGPLDLLIDDFLNKKTKLSLRRTVQQVALMNLFLD